MNSVFVTGTDTEVGKTRLSVALVELLQQQGKKIAVMKPVASGCDMTVDGLRNDDAMKLRQQADVDVAYDVVNPYAFAPAIAPHIAAKQANIEIDLDVIAQHFELIQSQADAVVVEGAGGWLVPINSTQTMADLAQSLALPVVLVVGIRLGCINHALLTVEAIKQSGLVLSAWVANNVEENPQSAEIIATLEQAISAPLLGEVPYLSAQQNAVDYLNVEKL